MTFSFKWIEKLSGKKATVYSVQLDDGTDLFDQFLNENSAKYENDVKTSYNESGRSHARLELRSISLKQKKETPEMGFVPCMIHLKNIFASTVFAWATP